MRNFTPTDVVKLNTDRLHTMPRDRAAVVAHEALDPLTDKPAHEQLMAVSLLFHVLCSRFNVHPADMHHLAGRVLRDQAFHKKGNAQIDALIDYANLHKTGHLST